MKLFLNLIPFFLLLLSACQVYVSADGSKHRQLFPAKDNAGRQDMDTSLYALRTFTISDLENEFTNMSRKEVFIPVSGTDLRSLFKAPGRHYIYFANPGCHATAIEVKKLDSLAGAGLNFHIISLRNNYSNIAALLSGTAFSRQPYYVIENDPYGNKLLMKKIGFIRDLCDSCYTRYRDDLAVVDYLLIEDQKIDLVFFNSGQNTLRQ